MLHEPGTRVRVLPEGRKGKPHRLAGREGTILAQGKSSVPGWYKGIYRIDFEDEIDFASHECLEVIEDEESILQPVGSG